MHPDAHVPDTVPPLDVHSALVKQVPFLVGAVPRVLKLRHGAFGN